MTGNCKTTFLCTINKPAKYAGDSMNTLLLAFYAKKLSTKPVKGTYQSKNEMKALIEK
jgi:hypothetical protein